MNNLTKKIAIIVIGIFLIAGFFLIYLMNITNNNVSIANNNNIINAEEECQALCEYVQQNLSIPPQNLTGACLSYPPTSITGRYWIYNGIDCIINSTYNTCLDHSNSYIILYNNCSLEEIIYNGKIYNINQ